MQPITMRDSDSLLQQVLEYNAMIGISYQCEQTILRCNHRFEEIFGFPPGGLGGQSSRLLFASQEAWEDATRQVAESVTEELTQQLHFLRQLIEAIPGPVFYKDREGHYLGCNQAFLDLLGRTRSDVIGATVYDLAPRDLANRYTAADDELLQRLGSQVHESIVRHADGSYREMWQALASGGRWQGELWNRRKNGQVFVEGVESEAQRDFLTRAGCDEMQGYRQGQPMPFDEYARRFLHA